MKTKQEQLSYNPTDDGAWLMMEYSTSNTRNMLNLINSHGNAEI